MAWPIGVVRSKSLGVRLRISGEDSDHTGKSHRLDRDT